MKLYTFWRSSAAYRARIGLNLKGLPYEQVPVHLRKGEQRDPHYVGLNPQGLVPALEDAGQLVTQSLAILEYLDERFPEPPFLPHDAFARAQVRSLALNIACEIHPLNNLRVLEYLRGPLGHDEATMVQWYRYWIAEGFKGLEEQARRLSGDGRHLYGNTVTLADICLVPQVANARRFDCDLSPYPTLLAIDAALTALPAFAAARPEVQPDAEA